MKYLITGGLGHIGSYLLKKIDPKDDIMVVDNMSTSRWCSLFNLDRNIFFLEKDICEITHRDIQDVDVVIHLAAITDAVKSFADSEEIEKVNVEYTSQFIKCWIVCFPVFDKCLWNF